MSASRLAGWLAGWLTSVDILIAGDGAQGCICQLLQLGFRQGRHGSRVCVPRSWPAAELCSNAKQGKRAVLAGAACDRSVYALAIED